MRLTHGMHGTPTYRSWSNMRDRCDNPNNPQYHRYGGRGISYDPKWHRFEGFLEDMGVRPAGLSLEREDNSGNYCKENCSWVDKQTQQNNTVRNNYIHHNGKTQTIAQWARETGMHPETIRARWSKTNDTSKVFAAKHKRQGLFK